jgi:hypothetical protein
MPDLPASEAETPSLETLRCPTCRASQPWSDTCRRCKCDLRLLRAAAEAIYATRIRCLALLRDENAAQALALARAHYDLFPNAESRRLLAVVAARAGDLRRAVSLARQTPSD